MRLLVDLMMQYLVSEFIIGKYYIFSLHLDVDTHFLDELQLDSDHQMALYK